MLGNRAYLGEASGGGAVREGAHPALVSRALFARCQGRGVQSQRSGRLAGRFLLQGIATCAACGRGLRLSTSGKGRAFYRCRTTVCPERGYAGARELDDYVMNAIEEEYDEADPSKWVPVPGAEDETEVVQAELALAEARAELDGWITDTDMRKTLGAASHTETAGSYAAVVAKCEADLEAARARHTGGWELAGRLWNTEWTHADRYDWLSRVLSGVVVHRGREALSRRVAVTLR